MLDKVCEIVEKYWLKPASSIFVAIVLSGAYAWTVSTLDNWEIIDVDCKRLFWIAIPFWLYGVHIRSWLLLSDLFSSLSPKKMAKFSR